MEDYSDFYLKIKVPMQLDQLDKFKFIYANPSEKGKNKNFLIIGVIGDYDYLSLDLLNNIIEKNIEIEEETTSSTISFIENMQRLFITTQFPEEIENEENKEFINYFICHICDLCIYINGDKCTDPFNKYYQMLIGLRKNVIIIHYFDEDSYSDISLFTNEYKSSLNEMFGLCLEKFPCTKDEKSENIYDYFYKDPYLPFPDIVHLFLNDFGPNHPVIKFIKKEIQNYKFYSNINIDSQFNDFYKNFMKNNKEKKI